MASVPVVIQRLRRARRESGERIPETRFQEYEDEYETIFSEFEQLAGESALEDLADWALEWTREEKQLPSPDRIRDRARGICDVEGVDVPDGSPLLE